MSQTIISGYLHLIQKELNLINIPPLVVHACFQFHGKVDESFESRFPLNNFDFDFGDNNKQIMLPSLSGQVQWAVGTAKFNPNHSIIATWTFKIHSIRNLVFSIVDNENSSIYSIHESGRTRIHRWKCDGFDGWLPMAAEIIHPNGSLIAFGKGDTFKITLDTYNMVVKVKRNEQNEVIIFKCNERPSELMGNCPWKIMIRVQSYIKAISLSLIEFDIVHVC